MAQLVNTVGELIEALKKFPEHLPVKADYYDLGYHTQVEVSLESEWVEPDTWIDKKEVNVYISAVNPERLKEKS